MSDTRESDDDPADADAATLGRPARSGWRSWNILAIIALIVGLVPWWWGSGSLLAMIMGIFALRQISRSVPQQRGYPIAIAAVVVGAAGLIGDYIASLLAVPT